MPGRFTIVIGRYSKLWWLAILLTTAVVGRLSFLLLEHLTGWDNLKLVFAVTVVAFLGDVATALSMEAVAPTNVDIGPGEKTFVADTPSERATVISGFDTSENGQVSIRGESWQAIRALDETGILPEGAAVRVVERRGLTLVVSAKVS